MGQVAELSLLTCFPGNNEVFTMVLPSGGMAAYCTCSVGAASYGVWVPMEAVVLAGLKPLREPSPGITWANNWVMDAYVAQLWTPRCTGTPA